MMRASCALGAVWHPEALQSHSSAFSSFQKGSIERLTGSTPSLIGWMQELAMRVLTTSANRFSAWTSCS
jgi:hypothetical protein